MSFTVLRIILFILSIVGTSFILPIATALYCGELHVIPAFLIPMLLSWLAGVVSFFMGRGRKSYLSVRASFSVALLAWICSSLFGALPLFASGAIPSFTNAVFESTSGFTTTGATILEDIESLPRSINLWRCLTHWIGGMGIVALTVALMPILGVGGFQLIKAETTGPEKGKFTPRITTTAKILWFIYLGLTLAEMLLLKLAGMDLIDAASHAFSTLGTGGFSTRNSSIASFNSPVIDWIIFVFMFLAGVNFSLYFYFFTGAFDEVKRNSEFKAYVGIAAAVILLLTLLQASYYGGVFKSLRFSAFQALAIMTTTGFSTADYTLWCPAAQLIILVLMFIGGSSGSTSGGIKVVRWVILCKQLRNEIMKLLHPHGVFSIRLNQRAGRHDVVYSVAAFLFLYLAVTVFTAFFGALFGMDLFTALTGAITMMDNCGPAFVALGPSCNCAWLAVPVKWFYSLVMIAGRLEIFTMFVFLTPAFWRK